MNSKEDPNMPLHSTIKEYIEKHPDFKACLKIYNLEEFAPLQTIIITGIDEYPDDEIIGLFVMQRSVARRRVRTFVQDYFVWHKDSNTFTVYTGLEKPTRHQSLKVKGIQYIDEFWNKYGLQKYYGTSPKNPKRGDHLYKTANDLPDILRDEARKLLDDQSKP